MKKYLDKIGGFIKKYVPQAGGQNGEHTQPTSYTIGKRKITQQKLLSEGAFGYIWRAVDSSTEEVFALKRIICTNAESLQQAKKELDVMRKLKPHPNLVGCYGGEVLKEATGKSTVVILMEMCPNGTLFDRLVEKQKTGFTESELLKILEGVARGIRAVHDAGFTHRDIKIENVIIGTDGNYKLCDFGSCTDKQVDFASVPSSSYHDYTEEMEKNTTPMYRPPEMVDPYLKYQVGFKSDVWMLGCVLYTLCYFIHPFLEATKIGISRAVYRIPQQSKHSEKINDLIRHMLTPDPSHRPSIDSVLDILSEWKAIKRIPLNQQAERLKKERADVDQQFGRYANKKTVEHDGDIPLEELMKVQAKLVQKVEAEQTITSFVQKKPSVQRPVPPQQPSMGVGPLKQPQAPTSQPPTAKPPAKASQGETLWDFYTESKPASSQPVSKTTEKDFDFFSSFDSQTVNPPAQVQKPSIPAPAPTQQRANLISNDDLMDYFDCQQPANEPTPPPVAPAAKPSLDLLDFL